MQSNVRIALAGLTTVALLGGVVVADPADAGKKNKGKRTNVVQVLRGGDATGGNGGNGGTATGTAGDTFIPGPPVPGPPVPGPAFGLPAGYLECIERFLADGFITQDEGVLCVRLFPFDPALFPRFIACAAAIGPIGVPAPAANVRPCLVVETPGPPVPGPPIRVPGQGPNAAGGNGGAATGGSASGSNTYIGR